MAKLTDTQKSLAILGGGIVLAVACGAGIYFDLGERDELKTEIDAQQKVKGDNDKVIAQIPTLKKELTAYRKIVSDNAKILPTEGDINAFIRDLSSMEKETGISIRTLPTLVPQVDRRDSAITRFPMKMNLTASTRAFLRFLNQLESRERLISVIQFRITPSTEEPKPGQDLEHDVQMDFDLYRYDPKAQSAKSPFRNADEELQLLETKEVKDLIATKGRPASIERYQVLPGRDGRRDLFVDPRPRLTKTGPDVAKEGPRAAEEILLQSLLLKLERARVEYESYRNAEQSKDFLRMAAAKRSFLKAKEELEADLRKVSANNPEFKSRDLQEKYLADVKRPFEKLMADAGTLGEGSGQTPTISEVMAAGMHKDLQELMDKRMFHEAEDKWGAIDTLVRDAGKNVEEAARPHIDAMRTMGEHSHFQALLMEKKIEVQGIVRMEHISAAIVNGRTLFPMKSFDKDTTFIRVEEGAKGEADRLIFKIQGHEVDYVQPKPPLLGADKAILTQD